MFSLFYILVLSVHFIDCIPDGKGNSNVNRSDPEHHSRPPNKGTQSSVENLQSQNDPGHLVMKGVQDSPRNPRAAKRSQSNVDASYQRPLDFTEALLRSYLVSGEPRVFPLAWDLGSQVQFGVGASFRVDEESSYQEPSASTGEIPRSNRARDLAEQYPPAREEPHCEDQFGAHASLCVDEGSQRDEDASYQVPSASTGAIPRSYRVREVARQFPSTWELLSFEDQFGAGASPRTDKGTLRDEDASYQVPSASTGAIPRSYRVREVAGQSPPTRGEPRREDQFGAGASPRTDKGTPRDEDASYQVPSASTGAIPRSYRVREVAGQSPPTRGEPRREDQSGAGASTSPSHGAKVKSFTTNPEPFNVGNPRKLQPSEYPNLFLNNPQWMHEEDVALNEDYNFKGSHYTVSSNSTSITNVTERVRNYLQSSLESRINEINVCEDLPNAVPRFNFINVPPHLEERPSRNVCDGPDAPPNIRKGFRDDPGCSVDHTFMDNLLTVDVEDGILEEEIYLDQSEIFYIEITSDLHNFNGRVTELARHLLRAEAVRESRLIPSTIVSLLDHITRDLNSMIATIEGFGSFFVDDYITAARLNINEFQYQFRMLKTVCYNLINTPFSYNYSDAHLHTVIIRMHEFARMSDELTEILINLCKTLAAHWESVDRLSPS